MYHLIFIVKIKFIMKVCILGDGLTSLTLAKALIKHGINVDIFCDKKIKRYNKIQTLGISKTNIDFFNKNILNIKKLLWDIKKIEIYNEGLDNKKLLNFENNGQKLFSVIKNFDLNKSLLYELKKNSFIKFKNNFNYTNLNKYNYKLIFNCDHNNQITKNFFYKKIDKDYNSYAHTTVIKHQKFLNNNSASQIFTKKGPIAFLPISLTETSVVYSVRGKKNLDLISLIKKYNKKYKILKINKVFSFELKSSNLRSYRHKNILAFGDLLHRLHPLAGQGFNMSIRDIKEIDELVKFKIDHGLDLDNSIFLNFEKNTRHKNYLFSRGVDLVYEFFNLQSNINNNIFNTSIKFFGNNKIINKFFTKIADKGIVI